eukprot:349907-Chlamydomonas_euryale.AAC.4
MPLMLQWALALPTQLLLLQLQLLLLVLLDLAAAAAGRWRPPRLRAANAPDVSGPAGDSPMLPAMVPCWRHENSRRCMTPSAAAPPAAACPRRTSSDVAAAAARLDVMPRSSMLEVRTRKGRSRREGLAAGGRASGLATKIDSAVEGFVRPCRLVELCGAVHGEITAGGSPGRGCRSRRKSKRSRAVHVRRPQLFSTAAASSVVFGLPRNSSYAGEAGQSAAGAALSASRLCKSRQTRRWARKGRATGKEA